MIAESVSDGVVSRRDVNPPVMCGFGGNFVGGGITTRCCWSMLVTLAMSVFQVEWCCVLPTGTSSSVGLPCGPQ